jgi:hypothetical protein
MEFSWRNAVKKIKYWLINNNGLVDEVGKHGENWIRGPRANTAIR